MSRVISFEYPARRPKWRAPTTPPAGPERMVRTGQSSAVSAEMVPPLDCMMWRRSPVRRESLRVRTYLDIRGATYALRTVVEVRSNSLNSPRIR
ncbi:MAG: hypothetical protein BWY88_01290 [Synergistetes bacterium ADurb.Bin520]|nr:MAG: hypothetical protein BWY88_01290 [Synergistetes bacterium ADurb.Bin520]